MKKLVVAGIALLVVGTAAFAAVRIGVYGVCPLTGRPICHAASVRTTTPDGVTGYEHRSESGAGAAMGVSADAFAAPSAEPISTSPCGKTRRHCCDEQAKVECHQPAQTAAPAPAPEPSTRP